MAKEFLDFHYSLNRLKLTVGHCLLVHVFYIILFRLASRDAYLAGAGLSVLRFSNTQVSQELATVVTIIAKTLLDRINPAQLLISGNTYQPTHFLTDNPTSPLS